MKHASRFILLAFVICTLIPIILSNTSLGSKMEIKGTWIVANGYDGSIIFDEYPASLSFSRNAKGTIDGMTMTWKIEDDKLLIAGAWGTIDYYYYVSGSSLYLSSKPIHGWSDMEYKKA